jgi:hypothetical protein
MESLEASINAAFFALWSCCSSWLVALRVSSINSLENLTPNPLCCDLCRNLEITETFAVKGDLMQFHHKFTISFFLQPHDYLSPCPCTKSTTLNGSKFNHLHLSGSFFGIFRISFTTSVCNKMGKGRKNDVKWTSEAGPRKIPWA